MEVESQKKKTYFRRRIYRAKEPCEGFSQNSQKQAWSSKYRRNKTWIDVLEEIGDWDDFLSIPETMNQYGSNHGFSFKKAKYIQKELK